MALVAAHLNAGVNAGGDSAATGIMIISLSLFPHLHNPFPSSPRP